MFGYRHGLTRTVTEFHNTDDELGAAAPGPAGETAMPGAVCRNTVLNEFKDHRFPEITPLIIAALHAWNAP